MLIPTATVGETDGGGGDQEHERVSRPAAHEADRDGTEDSHGDKRRERRPARRP